MTIRWFPFVATALLWPSSQPELPQEPKPAMPFALDRAAALYREDAVVPRPIAAVRAELRAASSGPELWLEVAAVGAGVEPLPGADGAPDANLRTAEELHFLLQDGELTMTTRQDGQAHAGRLERVERGHVPLRRLRSDGSIERGAESPAELPLRVQFRSAALPEGSSRTYLVAADVPRLCVLCERRGDRGRILAIESLGMEPVPAVRR